MNPKLHCIALCSNLHYKANAKEFAVMMQNLIFCQIKFLNFDDMGAGSLSSSIPSFASQRWKLGENIQKCLYFL